MKKIYDYYQSGKDLNLLITGKFQYNFLKLLII